MSARFRQLLAAAAALLVLTVVAYLPAVRHATFIWDDPEYLTNNPLLREPGGLRTIWFDVGATPQYYPLVFTTFWVEYRLWELKPAGYHAVNVALHALNAVGVWLVLRRLRVPGAWVAAAVFAVHPLAVESVAWVTERKNVLSTAFALASLLAYLRFAEIPPGDEPAAAAPAPPSAGGPPPGRRSRRRWIFYALSLVCFLLALLSKTVTSSLPAVILVITWWTCSRIRVRDVLPLLPMFALGISFGLLTSWMERYNVGALGDEWHMSFVERCLIAGRATWFYAGKLLWPRPLIFVYPRWHIDAHQAWQYLFPVAAAAVVVAAWASRRRWGRGVLAGVLLYGGLLFPALGFVDVYPMRFSFVADHFAYLAMIPLIALLVAGAARLAARVPAAGYVATVLVLATCAALTWRRTHVYRDAETLWRDTIARNPGAWLAHHNLGMELTKRGEYEAALQSCLAACAIKPDDATLRQDTGDLLLLPLRRPAEAVPHYLEVVRLAPEDARARNNLAAAYLQLGQLDKAEEQLRAALERNPDFLDAWANLASVEARQGRPLEAIKTLERAVERHPAHAPTRFDLGMLLASTGQPTNAIRQYEAGLQLNPNDADAHVEVAQLLLQVGRRPAALDHLDQALRLKPDHPVAGPLRQRLTGKPLP